MANTTARADARPCSLDECDDPVLARGWCNRHYKRWRKHGDPDFRLPWIPPQNPPRGTCQIDGCDEPHEAKGWCRAHYNHWYRQEHADRLNEYFARYRAANRERIRLNTRQWQEANRERARASCRAYAQRRKDYLRERRREYRNRNRDAIRALNNRYRARKKNAPVNDLTARQWRDIKAAYKHRCVYCGRRGPLTIDHVIPLSKSGPHTASNVVPACRSCNSSKNNREAPAYQPLLW